MAKYEFDLSVGIKEVLDADAAQKVESQMEAQRARFEEPIELQLSISDAKKRFKELEKEAKKVQKSLDKALSLKDFDGISRYTKQMSNVQREQKELLLVIGEQTEGIIKQTDVIKTADAADRRRKKTIQDITAVTEDTVEILQEQAKAIGEVEKAEARLQKTRQRAKKTESTPTPVGRKAKEVEGAYKTLGEIVEETKRSILGTDFDDIFSAKTAEGYAASLEKVRGKMAEIKDAARDAKKEHEAYLKTIASYTGAQLGNKSAFQNAIKDAWRNGDQAMAAKLFDSYQKSFPDGKFKPEKQFGAEWSDNFSKNLEEANRNLSYYRTQLKITAEAYGTYSAFLGLQNMEKQLTDGYNRMLQERAEAEKAAAEQANMLADAQKRFATNDVVTAQKNLNAAIDEYNAKVSESNRLLEEKRRIEDLDSYENEPWYNDYEFPVNKIMEISQQFAAAEDAANLFKIALKEAVRVYRELGGDMKLPLGADLVKEIDIPVKIVPVVEKPELLQHVEVLESRDEIYDAKTIAQKRKAAERMVRDEYVYYKQLEEALASPEHISKDGTVFDIEDIDLQQQRVRIEATIALYEKFGGTVDRLGKKIKTFADNWGLIGNYQFALDSYQATLIQETTEAIEQQTAATEKLAEAQEHLRTSEEEHKNIMSFGDAAKWSTYADLETMRSEEDKAYFAEHGLEVLEGLENRSQALVEALKPVDEMVSRISKNSSVKNLNGDALRQAGAEVGKALSTMYEEGIRDTEEYITLQYKLLHILDKIGDSYGGIKGSGASDKNELRHWAMDGIDGDTGYNIRSSYAIDALWGGGKFSIFESTSQLKSMTELVGDLIHYVGVFDSVGGGGGAKLDKLELKRLKPTIEFVRNNTQELQAAQQKMAETIKLIADLNNKYGAEKFTEIFGVTMDVFGELNISNAAEQYDALIEREKAYIEHIERRQRTLQEFTQSNTELVGQYVGTDSYEAVFMQFNKLAQAVWELGMPIEDANKQLQEFVATLAIAAESVVSTQNKFDNEALDHLVDSLLKLESVNADPLNEIVQSIVNGEKTISSEVQEILKSLNLLDDTGAFTGKYITEGMNNSGVVANDKYAIIARSQDVYDQYDDYDFDFKDGTTYIDNLIAKEQEAAAQGVNLARVLAVIKAQTASGEDLFYEIQEFAPGEQLHIFDEKKKNIQAFEQECARLTSASSEHIQKLMSDVIALNELGFFIDFSPANILHDATKGFTLIDLELRDLGISAQTTTELMEGLFACLTGFEGNEERIKPNMEDSTRWISSMLSVHNKLSQVFGENDFGADVISLISKYAGNFEKYAGQVYKTTSKTADSVQQTALQIEAQADAEKEVAAATQEQIDNAKEHLNVEKQVTAEMEKRQDIMHQILLDEDDDLGYKSPYSAEQLTQLTSGAQLNKIFKRFGVPKDKQSQITEQFNQWASLIAEQREFESMNVESVDDLPAMIDETMSQLVEMIMQHGTMRKPIEKTLEDFYNYVQDAKVKYTADDVNEFGSDWPKILRSFGIGKHAVLTQDKSALTINKRWGELLEVFPQLFDSSIINEKDQLKKFLDVVKAARDEHNNKSQTKAVDLPDYAFDNIMYDLSGSLQAIAANAEAMISSIESATAGEQGLDEAINNTTSSLGAQTDAAKRFAGTLSDMIDNEGAPKEIEKLFEPDVKNMIDNIRNAAQEGKVEFLQNILDSEELTTALTGAFSDAYNNIGDYKFRGKYPFEHDGLNKATIHLISKDESKTLDYVLKLEDGLLKIDKAKQKIGTTKFDISHEVNLANAEVDKLVAKLNGRQLDGLGNLRDLAKNIVDTESLEKFSKEFDVISQKVATLSSKASSTKGFNPLTNSVYEMENASITIETYAKQLERLGQADGVSSAAAQLDEMASAAERFKNATNQTEEEGAFADYQSAKSKYKAYYEYAQEARRTAEAEAKQVNVEEEKIRQYYQSILELVNKINSLDKEIEQAKGKNATGAFSEFINKTQEEKARLIGDVKATLSEVAGLFGDGIMGQNVSVGGAKFFSAEDTNNLNAFLQSAQVQTALAQGDVNKLSECLGQLSNAFSNSEKIAAQAAENIRGSLQKAADIGQKIFKLDQTGNVVGANGFNENTQLYNDALQKYKMLQFVSAELSKKPETDWTAEETEGVRRLSEAFIQLGTQIDTIKQKQDRFFADKQTYSLDALGTSETNNLNIDNVQKLGDASVSAKTKLEGLAQAIANNSNGAVALTKNFTQSADGISKLDFSVFDKNTNSMRDFTVAMGEATNQFAVFETTASKALAIRNAADKQLQSASSMLGTLSMSGVNIEDGSAPAQVQKLLNLMHQLKGAMDSSDENLMTKYTKDIKITVSELDKLYKQLLQVENLMVSDPSKHIGDINPAGNIYGQLITQAQEFASMQGATALEIGKFDQATNSLSVSLAHANGTTEQFKISMADLKGTCIAQQVGVGKLTNSWDMFTSTLKQGISRYSHMFSGFYMFYRAIAVVREGLNSVKDIDLALTELKKVTDETEESYAKFLNTAAETSVKIGSTVSEFTDATANFARLGYTMEESASMAETAIIYKNVADGIDSVDEASDSIISTMKAFGIESGNTMGIVDRFNEVGKHIAQAT